MDTIENMRAFLTITRLRSFVAAAEALNITPSVVTKRVAQLERIMHAKLLSRSTRKVTLTPEGEHHLARIAAAVAAHDQTISAVRKGVGILEGPIRIKVPTSFGALRLNRQLRHFARQHPGIQLEILLMDAPLNPVTEDIDVAITAFPASFDGVADEFLWSVKRVLVAHPDYLDHNEPLTHPRQLERHECIVYQPTGSSWSFLNTAGITTVNVPARLSSNDMALLLEAALDGEGIALLSRWLVQSHLDEGALQLVMPEFPVPDLWFKAMVPVHRLSVPRIASLLAFLRSEVVVIP